MLIDSYRYGGGSEGLGNLNFLPSGSTGVWSLRKLRTDYVGAAVRVGLAADSGSTVLDIGFDENGNFDWDTYAGFGTGNERVTILFDQMNNWDLGRPWNASYCPRIRMSLTHGEPCLYNNGWTLFDTSFGDWDGKTDVSIYAKVIPKSSWTGYLFAGVGAIGHYVVMPTVTYLFADGWSHVNSFNDSLQINDAVVVRTQFDIDAGTAVERGRIFYNGIEKTVTGPGITLAALPNEGGICINGLPDGSGSGDTEGFGYIYCGYDVSPEDDALIHSILSF